MALTKADIVEAVFQKIGVSKKESSDLVELIFRQIKASLASGNKIKISGFGNFLIRQKKPRMGRNPQTGESIEISARKVVRFRPSQVLRDEVNRNLSGKPIDPDLTRGALRAKSRKSAS